MRGMILFILAFGFTAKALLAQGPYRTVTIREIQEVPLDSLFLADQLQNTQPSRWTLQTSPFLATTTVPRETVEVVAQCIVPAKVLNFTATGWTMLLRDTTALDDGRWSYLFARANVADSLALTNDGFLNVERGDIIVIRGWVDEFPATSMNSVTQFVPVPGRQIDILDTKPIPDPPRLEVDDFFRGLFPGEVRYSTGEPFEGAVVELTNLTVVSVLNAGRGTVNMVDADGNMISTYDASGWFTAVPDRMLTTSEYTYMTPPVGSRIDTVRGMITTVSGSENPRGYRIAPLYPGDLKIGITLPSISTHRREPVLISSADTAHISVRAFQQSGGFPLGSVLLRYRVDDGPWQADTMLSPANDSVYHAVITPKSVNSFVTYFAQAVDSAGNFVNLASSATGGAGTDTSRGSFFYQVLDRPLTIQDVQYTPFRNGRSPYIGAVTSVSGVVTADSSDIDTSPLNTAGTHAWFMQTGTEPWNGLWIVGPDETMADLRRGDSITVTGTIEENFDVTRIADIQSPVQVHATSRPVPEPVLLTTGNFGPTIGNGNPQAEQWEGMLMRIENPVVSSINPVFSDATEYEINDGSGPMLVRRDGRNIYSNVEGDTILGKTIIHEGNHFSFMQGIIHFSFNRYKLVPRGNSDFGTLTSVERTEDRFVPGQFSLSQNFPNPFNPATVIEYNIPVSGLVSIKVYNLLGQEIATLVETFQQQGNYRTAFQAFHLPSGMYFYRLSVGNYSAVKKMLLLK